MCIRKARNKVFASSINHLIFFLDFQFVGRPHFEDFTVFEQYRVVFEHLLGSHGQDVDVGDGFDVLLSGYLLAATKQNGKGQEVKCSHVLMDFVGDEAFVKVGNCQKN